MKWMLLRVNILVVNKTFNKWEDVCRCDCNRLMYVIFYSTIVVTVTKMQPFLSCCQQSWNSFRNFPKILFTTGKSTPFLVSTCLLWNNIVRLQLLKKDPNWVIWAKKSGVATLASPSLLRMIDHITWAPFSRQSTLASHEASPLLTYRQTLAVHNIRWEWVGHFLKPLLIC